jgi:fructose-1,6-bisphosphatase II
MDDLVASNDVFFAATGITDGEIMDGVKYYGDQIRTDSLVVRGQTGTWRRIIAYHSWAKLKHLQGGRESITRHSHSN